MNIINFKNLAKNSLRKKALLIAEAGYETIDIERVINRRIVIKNSILKVATISGSNKYYPLEINLNNFERIFLVGIGKGSALASATLAKILGKRLTGGIALDVQKFKIQNSKFKILAGTHPLPSQKNIIATQKIIKLVKNLKKDDLLITFICGGGSALLCGSEKEMKNSILATKLLTQAGADILELNTVRKHLSDIKGGGLAKLAYPATVISLIVSDVLGNDLSMVASGPMVYDKTTKKDAERILKKHRLNSQKFHFIETPKDKKYFVKIKNILFLSNREPILAMAKKAKELGFKPKIYSYNLRGEARDKLVSLIRPAKNGGVILAGGETTVVLEKSKLQIKIQKLGKGGRNMEAVLGAIISTKSLKLKTKSLVIMFFASDGRDNTEAAGAIGDILTLQKAEKLKLKPQKYLNSHDSFNFFKKTEDLIFTEQKTFNVADLMIVLKK